ncbi:MAG: FAD-binding oxidoreductase [Propionibacteriaceae bacterium]|nr:FAD-binding oxidoreductase [Propionibacteriaceae bacterium]
MADRSLNRDAAALDEGLWGHRWGFEDTRLFLHPDGSVEMTGSRYNLCGYRMPYLVPFINRELGVEIDFTSARPLTAAPRVTPAARNEGFLVALDEALRAGQYTADDADRLLHSHGQTTTEEVSRVLYDDLERCVDLVVWPESEADCQAIVTAADAHGVCLIPFGGGTNVSSALLVPATETRMVVSVDTRRMNQVLGIDRANLTATVQSGITGGRLEQLLAAEGLTCGHEPDSSELSTLGGWISTNASGMKKNRYGNIEDLVENATLVTPSGVIEQRYASPRQSPGVQLQKALFGSEGNLGLVTKAVVHVHPLPEVKKYGSVIFADWPTGVSFMEALNRTGARPASIRLVDNLQFRLGQSLKPAPTSRAKVLKSRAEAILVTKVKKFNTHTMVAATIAYEGTAAEVAMQEKAVAATARRFGGLQGGSGNGQRGYMLTYAIAYLRDFLADYYVIGETYETTVPWDRIHDVCAAVDRVARSEHARLGFPGKPFTSPRLTQMYHSGVCIYFTHGLYHRGIDGGEAKFAEMERNIRTAIMDAGGSISHHHGVGKLRKHVVDRVASPETVAAVASLKQTVDPNNVFGVGNNIFG